MDLEQRNEIKETLAPIGQTINECSDDYTKIPDIFTDDNNSATNSLKKQFPLYNIVFFLLIVQVILFCGMLAMELCSLFKDPNAVEDDEEEAEET